jgi:hypothetical protein
MNFPTISDKALRFASIAALVWAQVGASTVESIAQTCAPTPARAVGLEKSVVPLESANGAGYRIATFHWDPLLRQQWAMIATCGHPERPTIAVRIPPAREQARLLYAENKPTIVHPPQGLLPAVHAGDLVRLWSLEDAIRIELSGIAEENAAMGRRIRVRVLRSTLADDGPPQTLSGVVRGFRDVEIER